MHLHSQRQGRLRWDDDLAAFVPTGAVDGQQIIGSARGSFALEALPGRRLPGRRHRRVRGRLRHRRQAPTLCPFRTSSRSRPVSPSRCGWSAGRDRDLTGLDTPLRRLPAGPDRGRRAPRHRRRHALRGAHQALHLDQHRQRPGQDLGVNAIGVIAAALNGRRSRRRRLSGGDRHHHLPGAVHAGRLRRAGRPRPRRPVRPRPAHLHPPLARGARRRVRGRRAVEAALVLPAGRRGHGRGRAARVRRRPQHRSA